MSFDVAAEAYDRFMGRYSRLLSSQLADFASVRSGERVLDVGYGTGALTSELVFMKDPVAGLAEMGRVTRRDGIVAACVWDHGGGEGPLRIVWEAARALDPEVDGESRLAGARKGQLAELFEAAGLREIGSTALSVSLDHPTFGAWWEPFTRGVGPAGAYLASLDEEQRITLRENCRRSVPSEPLTVTAVAWAARGLA